MLSNREPGNATISRATDSGQRSRRCNYKAGLFFHLFRLGGCRIIGVLQRAPHQPLYLQSLSVGFHVLRVSPSHGESDAAYDGKKIVETFAMVHGSCKGCLALRWISTPPPRFGILVAARRSEDRKRHRRRNRKPPPLRI